MLGKAGFRRESVVPNSGGSPTSCSSQPSCDTMDRSGPAACPPMADLLPAGVGAAMGRPSSGTRTPGRRRWCCSTRGGHAGRPMCSITPLTRTRSHNLRVFPSSGSGGTKIAFDEDLPSTWLLTWPLLLEVTHHRTRFARAALL